MTPARRGVAVLTAAVLCWATSGCVGLPSTSGVHGGRAISAERDDEPLAVEPLTASSAMDAKQVAIGFLRAQMSTRNNHAAARTFLGSGAQWRPGQVVTVFSSQSDITATRPDTTTVRLSVPVVGTLAADGHLQTAGPQERRTLDFTMREGRDGWRIAKVPAVDAVWISDADLARLYERRTVYYPAVQGKTLIPDPRWLPRQGATTALARAALSPPPSWLQSAVASAAPSGTGLGVDAVPVSNGTATVDLSAPAVKADNTRRAALWAAMTATILQAPEVRSVNLTVGSGRLEVENLPNTVTSVSDLGYSIAQASAENVIVRSGPYLAWSSADASDARTGATQNSARGRPKLPAVPDNWTSLAAGQGGRQVAAVSRDRMSLRRWVNGGDVTISSFGSELIRPTFDPSGWLWCAGRDFSNTPDVSGGPAGEQRGSIWAVDTTSGNGSGGPRRLDVPWLGDGVVQSMNLSPDGQRMAVVVKDGERSRGVVAAVIRDRAGHPSGLGPSHDIAQGVDALKDVVWVGPTTLGVLGTIGGKLQPGVQPLDEEVIALGALSSAEGLASTLDGAEGLFVRARGGTVFSRLGSSWNSFLSNGDVIVPTS